MATGRNRAIGRLHGERTLAQKTRLLDRPEPAEITMAATTIPDEQALPARLRTVLAVLYLIFNALPP